MTANASQLKYVLMLGQKHDFYQIMVALLASSIVLQVTYRQFFFSCLMAEHSVPGRIKNERAKCNGETVNGGLPCKSYRIIVTVLLQILVGVLSLSLNMMRDCRLHLIEYRCSAVALNYFNLASVFVITTLNILVMAFNPVSIFIT